MRFYVESLSALKSAQADKFFAEGGGWGLGVGGLGFVLNLDLIEVVSLRF